MSTAPAPGAIDRSTYAGVRLGIMQPYFFPYLTYFSLIAATDRWIVFDPVQYIRKGWVNRNRVLKKGGGWKYVGVTMAPHDRSTAIKDMRLAPGQGEADALVRRLDHYRDVRAPFYKEVVALIGSCFAPGHTALVPFLVHCLERCCDHLGLPFHYQVYSDMGLEHAPAKVPGEWALHICAALGASSYLNPPGGRAIFDRARFTAAGIELLYLEQALPPYDQRTNAPFEPGLSIIDVMMFNEPAAIRAMLHQHQLLAE